MTCAIPNFLENRCKQRSPDTVKQGYLCTRKYLYVNRLLVFLFSVTMLLATSPPRVASVSCDFSGGICTAKDDCSLFGSAPCTPKQTGKDGHKKDCGDESNCPLPICCICGPCCCLCIVPERPTLHIEPTTSIEERLTPLYYQTFVPQQVLLSIWKPPADLLV